jgi:hypothetical protein
MQSASRPAWRIDRPSVGASELSPALGGGRSRSFPRRTLEDKAVWNATKPFSDTPRGMVEEALQASGSRRRRPSRAFFAPYGTGHGHLGASLDALLLLPHPRRHRCREQAVRIAPFDSHNHYYGK